MASEPQADAVTPQAAQSRALHGRDRGRWILLLIVALLFLLCVGGRVVIYIPQYARALEAPGPNTVGEAGKVWFAKRAMRGESIFLAGDEPPYYPSVHGCLFHATVGWVGRAVGSDVIELYFIGRYVSLGATALALVLAGVMLRRLGGNWLWVLAAVLIFIAGRRVIQHSFSYRPDNWNLALAVLTCFLMFSRPRNRGVLTLIALLPAVAFFIKAPGVSILGAVVLVLLLERRFMAALYCGLVCVGAIAATVGALQWATSGAFLGAMGTGMDVEMSVAMILYSLRQPHVWVFLFLPAMLLGRYLPIADPDARRRRTVAAFWLVSLVAYGLAAARSGSNAYYFVQPFVFGIVLSLDWFAARVRQDKGLAIAPAALAVLFCLQGVPRFLSEIDEPFVDVALQQTERFADDRSRLADEYNARGYYVFSDDPGLNVLLEKPAVILPMFVAQRIETGDLSIDAITAPLRRGEYDRVVMTGAIWMYRGTKSVPEAFFDSLDKFNLRDWKSQTRYQIYLPIPRRFTR